MSNYLFTFILACIFSMAARAQGTLVDGNGQPWRVNNPEGRVDGTPMLAVGWGKGYVQLVNGKRADSLTMNMDLEYHRPMYTLAGVVYEFSDSVEECAFTYLENGLEKTALFRSGYPVKDKRKEFTLYQVLAEGPKYELVQYSDKKPTERREFNGPMQIHYDLYSELYIYDLLTGSMQKIKNKKSSVIDALPGKKEAIEKICSDNNLDLKSGEQIAMLISKLQ